MVFLRLPRKSHRLSFNFKNLKNVPKGTIIKFGNVEFNDGNGYNQSTGKFTAPVDGNLFVFYGPTTYKKVPPFISVDL